MKLKKINAYLALLTTLTLVIHILYNIYSYLTFYYNPALKMLTAIPFIVLCCCHSVTGMCSLFLLSDGTRLDVYQKENIRTVLQRITAALIFPLLFIHINTFGFLSRLSESNKWGLFALVIIVQILFYTVSIAHASLSFSKAFITLGFPVTCTTLRKMDLVAEIAGFVLFAVASYAVVRGQLLMFLP